MAEDKLEASQRGRPRGATDSYQRDKGCTKPPPSEIIEAIMPRTRALIKAAYLAGYHNGLRNAGSKSSYNERKDKEAVDQEEMKLLAEIRRVIDGGNK